MPYNKIFSSKDEAHNFYEPFVQLSNILCMYTVLRLQKELSVLFFFNFRINLPFKNQVTA